MIPLRIREVESLIFYKANSYKISSNSTLASETDTTIFFYISFLSASF